MIQVFLLNHYGSVTFQMLAVMVGIGVSQATQILEAEKEAKPQ
jgi:hypothetical protein